MKRFAFRLERLRELRARAEREQAAVLGAAMRAESERQELLARAQQDAERMHDGSAAIAQSAPQQAGLLHSLGHARDVALLRVEDASEELRSAAGLVEDERTRYGETRRDLRVIEKLKERRLETWREESAREEQKETDNVARRCANKGEQP